VIDERTFHQIRTRLALDHAKWDPRIGDSETLARFALILPGSVWRRLARLAERLAAEALEAETELLSDPVAIGCLGLPRPISHQFRRAATGKVPLTPALARVVRFDFHPTAEGWKISEANADVPGGYAEASEFPRLMAELLADAAPAGHPGDELARAILDPIGETARVALVSAPGYLEDLQVTAYLADRLRRLGAEAFLVQPNQIHWERGWARVVGDLCDGPIDAIFRFYQGEWVASGPRRAGWKACLVAGLTPTCNPGSALFVESKRFPLAWPRLRTPMPAWRALLPESVDPRTILGRMHDGWVLKQAFCNTGDSVFWPGSADKTRWQAALWNARLRPSRWVAQRRFEALALETPVGPLYPCLGVYTINGRVSGIYGRLARRPLIDSRATDVAVLIREDSRQVHS
jgi:glutathionylspermidine synthase